MQFSSLIHRDTYAGHDGTDRTIKVCFAAIAPVLLLMRLLIDDEVRFLGWDSFTFIYISIYQTGDWDYVGIDISLLFRVLCECVAVIYPLHEDCWFLLSSRDWVCVCVRDRKREYLPPNWYDGWHFIYCSWPTRLIMPPKAIRDNRTYTTHVQIQHMHGHACTHTYTHSP